MIISRVKKVIRHRGIKYLLHSLIGHMWYLINKVGYYICCLFPVSESKIIFESEGDLSDNAFALYSFFCKSNIEGYQIIWLVQDPKAYVELKKENTKCAYKSLYCFNFKICYHLATCKWYIYDHNNLMAKLKKREEQKIIYLCHGYAGFKKGKGSGGLQRLISPADEYYTTGEIPVQGLEECLGIPREKIFILGFSRLDWFYSDLTKESSIIEEALDLKKYKKVLLWMPTFRKSNNLEISENYLDNGTGLPLFDTIEKYHNFNQFLLKNNVLCILKLHHLQAEFELFKSNLSNIKIIRDDDLRRLNVQLYQFIPKADALISDYSSVSTDFMLLDRPIIYILDDYEQYNESRGIYPKNALDLMAGDHVFDIQDLEKAILRVVNGEDTYREKRRELVPAFHSFQDGRASERILKHLQII